MCVLRRAACLVVGQVGVDILLASLVARRWVGPRDGWRFRPRSEMMVTWAVGGWRPFRVSWVGLIMVWLVGFFGPDFQCWYFCESSCLFCLVSDFDIYVSKIMRLCARNLPRKPNNWVSEEPGRGWGRGLDDRRLGEAPQ